MEVQEDVSSREKASYLEFLRVPGLKTVLLYNVLVGYLFRSVDIFFPSFLSIDRMYSGEIAAFANSIILFFGTFGQIIGGRGSDKFGSTRILMIMTGGMVLSLCILLFLPNTGIVMILFIVLYGISMFGHQPTITKIVSTLSPRPMMGLAYGLMFFSAFGVGSLSTTVTGYFADVYSLTTAFLLNIGIAVILFIVSILIYKKLRISSGEIK
jgi:MFS family permease